MHGMIEDAIRCGCKRQHEAMAYIQGMLKKRAEYCPDKTYTSAEVIELLEGLRKTQWEESEVIW